MKDRNLEIKEFLQKAKSVKLKQEERKEINSILKKVVEIKQLREETKQKKINYNYLKEIMLPSDYTKINRDLREQREFKVARESRKFELELIAKGRSQEEIQEETEKYRTKLCKQYGLRTKGKIKEMSDEEDLTLENIEEIEMEE